MTILNSVMFSYAMMIFWSTLFLVIFFNMTISVPGFISRGGIGLAVCFGCMINHLAISGVERSRSKIIISSSLSAIVIVLSIVLYWLFRDSPNSFTA